MNEKMSMMEKQHDLMQRESASTQTIMELKNELASLKSQKDSAFSSTTESSALKSKLEETEKQLRGKCDELQTLQIRLDSLTDELEATKLKISSVSTSATVSVDLDSDVVQEYTRGKISAATEQFQQSVDVLTQKLEKSFQEYETLKSECAGKADVKNLMSTIYDRLRTSLPDAEGESTLNVDVLKIVRQVLKQIVSEESS